MKLRGTPTVNEHLNARHTPAVSVIMPVFNGGKYLSSAVESILAQTFDNLELIVIDDGSTDGAVEQLGGIEDPRLRLVSQANSGLPAALNRGIWLARGCYIARMDADDLALPGRFETQNAYLQANPHLDLIGSQAGIIDDQGRLIGEVRKPVREPAIMRYLEFACPLIHPTYFGKASVFKHVGGYREMPAGQDFDFLLRAVEAGVRLGNVQEQTLLYRQSPSGVSARNARTQMANTRRALVLHRKRMAGEPEPPGILARMQGADESSGAWFEFWWRTRSNLLVKRRAARCVTRSLLLAGVVASSLMHYELACATYRGWRSLRYKNSGAMSGMLDNCADV